VLETWCAPACRRTPAASQAVVGRSSTSVRPARAAAAGVWTRTADASAASAANNTPAAAQSTRDLGAIAVRRELSTPGSTRLCLASWTRSHNGCKGTVRSTPARRICVADRRVVARREAGEIELALRVAEIQHPRPIQAVTPECHLRDTGGRTPPRTPGHRKEGNLDRDRDLAGRDVRRADREVGQVVADPLCRDAV